MSDLKASNTSETLQPKLNVKLPPTAEAVLKAAIPESQGDIDRETSKIRLQTEKLKLKRELLELEKLTDDIEKIREEKSNLAYAHDTVEDSIKYQKESMRANQEACTHKKGGEATQLLGGAPSMGDNANNYALLTHTFTSGVIFRMCMRCGRTWFPKDPDYNWAMRLPSKNSPSTGSPSPGLTKHPERVRMVSEIEHRPLNNQSDKFNSDGPAGY